MFFNIIQFIKNMQTLIFFSLFVSLCIVCIYILINKNRFYCSTSLNVPRFTTKKKILLTYKMALIISFLLRMLIIDYIFLHCFHCILNSKFFNLPKIEIFETTQGFDQP